MSAVTLHPGLVNARTKSPLTPARRALPRLTPAEQRRRALAAGAIEAIAVIVEQRLNGAVTLEVAKSLALLGTDQRVLRPRQKFDDLQRLGILITFLERADVPNKVLSDNLRESLEGLRSPDATMILTGMVVDVKATLSASEMRSTALAAADRLLKEFGPEVTMSATKPGPSLATNLRDQFLARAEEIRNEIDRAFLDPAGTLVVGVPTATDARQPSICGRAALELFDGYTAKGLGAIRDSIRPNEVGVHGAFRTRLRDAIDDIRSGIPAAQQLEARRRLHLPPILEHAQQMFAPEVIRPVAPDVEPELAAKGREIAAEVWNESLHTSFALAPLVVSFRLPIRGKGTNVESVDAKELAELLKPVFDAYAASYQTVHQAPGADSGLA